MFNKAKKWLIGSAALASAAMAETSAPAWWPNNVSESSFDGVLSSTAPIAVAVVVGVAGIRVLIKLINRGAGK